MLRAQKGLMLVLALVLMFAAVPLVFAQGNQPPAPTVPAQPPQPPQTTTQISVNISWGTILVVLLVVVVIVAVLAMANRPADTHTTIEHIDEEHHHHPA